MIIFNKQMFLILCIISHGQFLLGKLEPDRKVSKNSSSAYFKMAVGGLGMAVTAGTIVYSLCGGNHIISADRNAYAKLNRAFYGDYPGFYDTSSAAFTLTSPIASSLSFAYFLHMFQQGFKKYQADVHTKNAQVVSLFSKGLDCYKIVMSSVGYLPALSVASDVLSWDEDSWNPRRVGLEALFSISAVGLSLEIMGDTLVKFKKSWFKKEAHIQARKKSSLEKFWLLTQIATGCIGTVYGAEGMYQSLTCDIFKKHGIFYTLSALSSTTLYTLLSAKLAHSGWSKI